MIRARILLLPLCLMLGCGPGTPGSSKPWNVVLITLDTTRFDALGCYGAGPTATPNLDRLARGGTRFDLAISPAALTPVAHASILTGLNTMEHGLRVLAAGSGFQLPTEIPTLATVLHDAGYATFAVHGAFPVSTWFGFDRGFDHVDTFDTVLPVGQTPKKVNVLEYQRRADQTTDLALAAIAHAGKPFFLWTHYWDPHDDVLVPPAEFLPADLPRDPKTKAIVPSRELYAAEVHFVDAQIGRLIAELERSGEFERTLFVVIADHGEALGQHEWWHHRLLYQEQIHVPLIVRAPGAPTVASTNALVQAQDVFPTVLDFVDVRAPRPVSAKSLRPLMQGAAPVRRVAYADALNGYDFAAELVHEQRPLDDFLYCAMDAEWKLIYRPAHPEQSLLFQLSVDAREEHNLFTERADKAREFLHELGRFNGWVDSPFPLPAPNVHQTNARNALNSLGYFSSNGPPVASTTQWAWTCPEHPELRQDHRVTCPRCSQALIMVKSTH